MDIPHGTNSSPKILYSAIQVIPSRVQSLTKLPNVELLPLPQLISSTHYTRSITALFHVGLAQSRCFVQVANKTTYPSYRLGSVGASFIFQKYSSLILLSVGNVFGFDAFLHSCFIHAYRRMDVSFILRGLLHSSRRYLKRKEVVSSISKKSSIALVHMFRVRQRFRVYSEYYCNLSYVFQGRRGVSFILRK